MAQGKKKDKARINFNRVVLYDGRSLPISVIGCDPDESLGVTGTLNQTDFLKAAALPLLSDTISAGVSNLRQQPSALSALAGTAQVTPSSALEGGAADSLQKVSAILLQNLQENQPYVTVDSGCLVKGIMMESIDVSKAARN